MAEVKVEGPELKKLVKLCKKKPLAFAFSPGKKPDEHIMAIDRRKDSGFLGRNAKKESTGNKVAFGTCSVKGKLMSLTCEQVVPTMAKTMKKYLKSQKITLNIEILDINGNTIESDIEDLPDDPEFDDDSDLDLADEDTSADDDDDNTESDEARRARLTQQLAAMVPSVKAAPAALAEKLMPAMKAVKALLDGNDLDKAEAAIGKIQAALGSAPKTETAGSEEAKPADPRALAARAGALKQVIEGMAEPARGKLMAALGGAAGMIKAGDLASADTALTKIEAAANKVMASAPPAEDNAGQADSADARKWAAAEARLQPLVDKAMQEKRGDLDGINRAFNYAKDLAADGAYDRALASAGKVAELLKAAASATTTAAAAEAEASIPADVVPYVQSRLAWITTRSELRKELEGLKSAIDATTANVEGLEEVPAKSGVLFDYLNDIDSNLEDTLEKLVESPDGEPREALKAEARQIIDTYRGVLDTEFFQAVDNNGFVATNIRGAALDSLQKVSAALAA